MKGRPKRELGRVRRHKVGLDFVDGVGQGAAFSQGDAAKIARNVDRAKKDFVQNNFGRDKGDGAAGQAGRDKGVEPLVPGVAERA